MSSFSVLARSDSSVDLRDADIPRHGEDLLAIQRADVARRRPAASARQADVLQAQFVEMPLAARESGDFLAQIVERLDDAGYLLLSLGVLPAFQRLP